MWRNSPTAGTDIGLLESYAEAKQLGALLKDPKLVNPQRLERSMRELAINPNQKKTKNTLMASLTDNPEAMMVFAQSIDRATAKEEDETKITHGGVTDDEAEEIEGRMKDAKGWETPEERKKKREKGEYLTANTMRNMSATDIADLMPKLDGKFKDIAIQFAARFWDGPRASALGKRFGMGAVDSLQDELDTIGDKVFDVDQTTGATGNIKLARWIATNAGAEFGLANIKKAGGDRMEDEDVKKRYKDATADASRIRIVYRKEKEKKKTENKETEKGSDDE
jgi:hypothetical protein